MPLNIEQIQSVIFLSTFDRSSAHRLRLVQAVQDIVPDLQQSDPTVLPLDNDLPAEFPNVIIRRTSGQGWAFQYALSRCDLIYTPPPATDSGQLSGLLKQMTNNLSMVWAHIQAEFKWQSNRLGFVVTTTLAKPNATQWMSKQYLRSSLVDNPAQIHLQYITRASWDHQVTLNHWTRLSSRPAESPDSAAELFVLQSDVNIDPATEYEVNTDSLLAFMQKASQIALNDIKEHERNL